MLGTLFIISAPSGAGKTSLVKALRQQQPEIALSISHTTRTPRPGEQNGIHYHFVDESQFLKQLQNEEFLEYARVHDHLYGTSRRSVLDQIEAGKEVILEIDWQGANQIRKQIQNVISIFILPPSLEVLRQRLQARGQDHPEIIEKRLKNAIAEIHHCTDFDYLIINRQFETALAELMAIFTANRLRYDAQSKRHAQLINALLA